MGMSFSIPFRPVERVYSGPGALLAASRLPAVRRLVVLSRSAGAGLEDSLAKTMKCHRLSFIYKTWPGEPELSDVEALAGEMEKAAPDNVVAVGGGSLIDAVKAARALYEHPDLGWEKLRRPFSLPKCLKSVLTAVPTTIGAGAEASSSAVLKDGGRKCFIVSHELLPSAAVLDPALVAVLPPAVRLATLADALTHALEAYVSSLPQLQARDCAALAVGLIAANRAAAGEPGEFEPRAASDLQRAALYAGYAQNHCLVGAAHALAHVAAENGVEHGLANAFYLPAVIETNAEDENVRRAYVRLAARAGLAGGLEALLALVREISGAAVGARRPGRLTSEQLRRAAGDPGGRANPRPLSEEFLTGIEALAHA